MALLGRLAPALALVAFAGCGQTLKFTECTKATVATDCPGMDANGHAFYCTSDGLCVSGVPEDELCPAGDIVNPSGTIVFASLVNRSNPDDQDQELASVLAINEINNQQSAVNMPGIQLVLCDTGDGTTKGQSARAATLAITKYHATALLGPSSSGGVKEVLPVLTQYGVLAMSASATSASITDLPDNNLVWRTCPSDALQGKILAALVKAGTPAPTKIDTLYVNDDYGLGLSQQFSMQFQMSGVMVSNALQFDPSTVAARISALDADGPSDALLVVDDQVGAFINMLEGQSGLAKTRFFMSDSAESDDLLKGPKDVLDRIQGTTLGLSKGNPFNQFQLAYRAAYPSNQTGAKSPYAAAAYDAAYLVALAAAAAPGHVTGPDLAAGLVKCSNQMANPIDIGSAGYIEAVNKIQAGNIALNGATGPIAFTLKGDPVNASFDVWTVDTSGASPVFMTMPAPM